MSAPSDITSLRAAYKAKRQQFEKMDGDWRSLRYWAEGLHGGEISRLAQEGGLTMV
jgi:hypothetical protein